MTTLPMRDDHGPSSNQLPKSVRRMRRKLDARRTHYEGLKDTPGFRRPGSQKMRR